MQTVREMQVDEDEVGPLVAREAKPVRDRRRADEPYPGPPRQRSFDQSRVDRIVLDLEHRGLPHLGSRLLERELSRLA